MWGVWHDEAIEEIHIAPEHDTITHELDESCVCGPSPELINDEKGDAWMYTHCSLDGRERYE